MSTIQKVIKYIAIAFGIFLSINIICLIVLGITTISEILIGVSSDDQSDFNYSNQYIALQEYSEILNLDIKLNTSNIIIKEGDKLKVEINKYSKDFTCDKENNTLVLKDNTRINKLLKNSNNTTIVLYIPKEYVFSTVDIKSGIGKCEIEYLNATKLDIELGVGETIIENIISKDCNIDGGIGKANIKSCDFHSLDLETGIGNFNLSGNILNTAKISCGIGKTNINLNGKFEDYSINTKVGIGVIKLNNNKCLNESTYGNGNTKINISGGIGAVDISTKEI